MEPMYYIGLDVHKQKIGYCRFFLHVKEAISAPRLIDR